MGATYSRTVRTTTAVEYSIARGSNIRDFFDILHAAARELQTIKGDDRATENDHWCQVDADDEKVIIRFVTEKTTDGGR